ncbi:hypothetical protein QR680_007781 [Steinernema hermaphroditum]|uniref:Uncharacterized protein n=1 Tax=Steinernema hermaphroditum TaxID=289476 RepID=A0AA39IE82_9BILA|nr:hypothetical protein QR680_007781 [Steinernema hermaphroditum]
MRRILALFTTKIGKIYERFGGVLQENMEKLTPKTSDALKKIIAVVNDPDNGIRQKIDDVRSELQGLGRKEHGELVQYVVLAIGEYGKKYGNPILGEDSILGKQT